MRFQEVVDLLPPREEMARLARYFTRARQRDRGTQIITAAAGLLVGATVALLFAPNSGRVLRRTIGERAEHLKDRASEIGSRARSNGVSQSSSL